MVLFDYNVKCTEHSLARATFHFSHSYLHVVDFPEGIVYHAYDTKPLKNTYVIVSHLSPKIYWGLNIAVSQTFEYGLKNYAFYLVF